ncbi:MAG: hypothetical protein LBT99_04370 [Bifidobacteriaceae bacterium]|nr:hypothetical protein [Bifidobacteriaceae bacterium]
MHSQYRQLGSRELIVFNKIDLLSKQDLKFLKLKYPKAVFISVKQNLGIKNLKTVILTKLLETVNLKEVVVPYENSQNILKLYNPFNIVKQNYANDGIHLLVKI